MASVKEGALNAFVSLFEPELRPLAERFATQLAEKLPEDSALRSKIAERLAGGLKGLFEAQAWKAGPIGAVAIEKLTDLMDFGSASFFEEKGARVPEVTERWLAAYLAYAHNRLAMAEQDELQAEMERLEEEFALRKQIAKLVRQAVEEEPEETDDSSGETRLAWWTSGLEEFRGWIRSKREDRGSGNSK